MALSSTVYVYFTSRPNFDSLRDDLLKMSFTVVCLAAPVIVRWRKEMKHFFFLENKGKERPARTPHEAFGRVVLSPSNYTFAFTSISFEGFSLFVRDDQRFCKNCFQQGLIVYQTPMFHQYYDLIFWPSGGTLWQKATIVRDLLAFVYVKGPIVDPRQSPSYDVFWVPSCFETLFEFQKDLFKCFFEELVRSNLIPSP